MNNLFEYATKELSQDAFLLWVLSNATVCGKSKEDIAVNKASIDFISFLTKKNNLNISSVRLKPQWNKIDVVAEITTKEGDRFNIFIEDKTTSNEHNQLDVYSQKIKNNKEYSVSENYRIFYKTDIIDDEERRRVVVADWTIMELDDIAEFWEGFQNSDNCIISMYAKKIKRISSALKTNILPPQIENREIEMLTWKGFFINTVIPNINNKCTAYLVKTSYKYIALIIMPKNIEKNKNYPYLEIRDRDCINGKFLARVLTYGMADKKEKCKEFDLIQDENTKISGTIYKNSAKNSTKQVLNTVNIDVKNETEFINQLSLCIDIYLEIMNKIYSKE